METMETVPYADVRDVGRAAADDLPPADEARRREEARPRPAVDARRHRGLPLRVRRHRRCGRPGDGVAEGRRRRVRRAARRAPPGDPRLPGQQPQRLVAQHHREPAHRAHLPRAGAQRDDPRSTATPGSRPIPTCSSAAASTTAGAAKSAIGVRVTEVFFHCPASFQRATLWDQASWRDDAGDRLRRLRPRLAAGGRLAGLGPLGADSTRVPPATRSVAGVSPLISAAELLADLASDAPPLVLDVRWSLGAADPAWRARGRPHPGLPLRRHGDASCPRRAPADAGRHPLPDPDVFAATATGWGVGPDTAVVVYDDTGGMSAARLWWLLRWIGHHAVRVLDGGLGGVAGGRR